MAFVVKGNLFLHVPKTGGKATLTALRRAGNRVRPIRSPGCHVGHARESQLADRRYRWNFRFGFVRHPVSWWKSLRDFGNSPESKLFGVPVEHDHPFREIISDCRRLQFAPCDEFVGELAIVRHPGFFTRMIQFYFGDKFDAVEWVGRQENLQDDLRELCKLRGLKIPETVERVNVSTPVSPGDLSAETIARVLSSENEIVERFYAGGWTSLAASRGVAL